MKFLRALSIVLLMCLLVACGEGPTSAQPQVGSPSTAARGSETPPPDAAGLPKVPEEWEGETPAELCRGWHASEAVGSGYAERFLFLEDGTFYFAQNEMDTTNRLRYMDGTWRCTDGVLTLTVQRKITIEGGEAVERAPYPVIQGGAYVRHEFAPGETEELHLRVQTVLVSQQYGDMPSILLNETQYWGKHGVDYSGLPTMWEDALTWAAD